MRMDGLQFQAAANALVAEDRFSRAQADGLVATLEAANTAGRFYCTAAMHVVAGRKPAWSAAQPMAQSRWWPILPSSTLLRTAEAASPTKHSHPP